MSDGRDRRQYDTVTVEGGLWHNQGCSHLDLDFAGEPDVSPRQRA